MCTVLTLVVLNQIYPFYENTVDPDQLASDEAILDQDPYCFSDCKNMLTTVVTAGMLQVDWIKVGEAFNK